MNGIYDLYRLYGICASDLSISCQLQLVDIKKKLRPFSEATNPTSRRPDPPQPSCANSPKRQALVKSTKRHASIVSILKIMKPCVYLFVNDYESMDIRIGSKQISYNAGPVWNLLRTVRKTLYN